MNADAKKYLKLMIDLHDLIDQGKGDDQEADDLRDEMDAPCHRLSENDTKVIAAVSAILYTLDGADSEGRLDEAVGLDKVMAEKEKLAREIEYLRHYGNKDCTAMADEALVSGTMDES